VEERGFLKSRNKDEYQGKIDRRQGEDDSKQGDLMVVANAGDSRVVLGTASDDDAITPSSSSST
jgi:hypothetical protein